MIRRTVSIHSIVNAIKYYRGCIFTVPLNNIIKALKDYINNFSLLGLFKVIFIIFIVGVLTSLFLLFPIKIQINIIFILMGSFIHYYSINRKIINLNIINTFTRVKNNMVYIITYITLSRIILILMFSSIITLLTFIDYGYINENILPYFFITPIGLIINNIFGDWLVLFGITNYSDYTVNITQGGNINNSPPSSPGPSGSAGPSGSSGPSGPSGLSPNPNEPPLNSFMFEWQSREQVEWQPQEEIEAQGQASAEAEAHRQQQHAEQTEIYRSMYDIANNDDATHSTLKNEVLRRLNIQQAINKQDNTRFNIYSDHFPYEFRIRGRLNACIAQELGNNNRYSIMDNRVLHNNKPIVATKGVIDGLK